MDTRALRLAGGSRPAPRPGRGEAATRRRRQWSRRSSPPTSRPGASLFGVSRHLRDMGVPAPRGGKAWSTATLRGILTNPVYTGKVYAGRVRYRPARIRRSATHPIGHPHSSSDPLPDGGVDLHWGGAGGGRSGAVRPRRTEALQEQVLRQAQQQGQRAPPAGFGKLRRVHAGLHSGRQNLREEQRPQAEILRVLGQVQQSSERTGGEMLLALRPGRTTRRRSSGRICAKY